MRFLSFAVLAIALSVAAIAQQPPETTEHHKLLEKEVGTWDAKMTVQVPGADKPMTMDGKETNRLIAGGLWLVSEFESGPFKGHGQLGFDPQLKKYVGTWVDNSSAHLNVMQGEYDQSKGELTMFFEGVDHATGKLVDMKSISSFSGADKRTYVMYEKKGDDWVQSFDIQYERAK